MVNLIKYYSHPTKLLDEHLKGVVKKTKFLTNIDLAMISAIFHDVGKINPNFQDKINSKSISGYSNHSYLSAISFLLYISKNLHKKGTYYLLPFNNSNIEIKEPEIFSILAIITHHHGDLPNFSNILNENECLKLLSFIEENQNLPIAAFLKNFIPDIKGDFTISTKEAKYFYDFQQKKYYSCRHCKPTDVDCIDFFLKTRFAFASVIVADKSDAGNYQIQESEESVRQFNILYNKKLDNHVKKYYSNSCGSLNDIRTKMREESISKLEEELKKGSRVFSLTAPTGSGKTIMLLSLAGKIVNNNIKNNLRIIYALPYLSITEQVENICNNIFNNIDNTDDYIRRIDYNSDNENFKQMQSKLNSDDPNAIKDSDKSITEIIASQFAEDIFDYPFIITTFVRFFEALTSNKNETLLKLPNFANAIFLIDEIQSIPPRLYGFFVALLNAFCKKFNSYAIISTATMPNFKLPENNKHKLYEIFNNYIEPVELLSLEYFKKPVFNRYSINKLSEPVIINNIADIICKEQSSTLVILNTIQDTKDLFKNLKEKNINSEIILINTHFTLNDRKEKIERCKFLLDNKKQVILISTQLIEAGVDIDFPTVYRDFCPIPNIVQSAGRCNRNGTNNKIGKVVIFELQKNNKNRSALIYKNDFLDFAKKEFQNFKEKEELKFIDIQQTFFNHVQKNTLFGVHYNKIFQGGEIDFIEAIKNNDFGEIGKFKLIDDSEFGEEYHYYIAKDKNDDEFERLQLLHSELKQIDFQNFQFMKIKKIEINNQLKKMSGNILRIRLKSSDSPPLKEGEYFGLSKLSSEYYDKETGIRLTAENQIL